MEFTHGRRERFHIIDQEEAQAGVSKHSPFNPSSSSSTALSWHDGGNSGGGGDNSFVEKEHMFDKVVTPSDVGKLNRLVIPKQHAEKYFPLDTTANEKGLLLSFEDRNGKPWRFRYSYWNSSQSYVMTKGWSRFVKEKGLDAGDTVSFGRGVGEAGRQRLYIDWKRQPEKRVLPPRVPLPGLSFARSATPGPWTGRLFVPPDAAVCGNNWQGCMYSAPVSSGGGGPQLLYFRLPPPPRPPQMEVQQVGGSRLPPVALDSVPLVHDQAAPFKRVRLFGVNLNCPESGGDADHHVHSLSTGVPQLHPRTALPTLEPPHAGSETPVGSSSSSSSMSKEQRSPLDLFL